MTSETVRDLKQIDSTENQMEEDGRKHEDFSNSKPEEEEDAVTSVFSISNSKFPPFDQTRISGALDQDQVLLGQASVLDHELYFGLGPHPKHGLEVGFEPSPEGSKLNGLISSNKRGKWGNREQSPTGALIEQETSRHEWNPCSDDRLQLRKTTVIEKEVISPKSAGMERQDGSISAEISPMKHHGRVEMVPATLDVVYISPIAGFFS